MTLPSPAADHCDETEVAALVQRGVLVPVPSQVAIHRSVPLERIARGAVLHPFTRLSGAQTRVDPGAVIGKSGSATLENAWVGERAVVGDLGPVTLRETVVGPGAVLGCGVAEQAVFLGKESTDTAHTTGYGFRVRRGSLYEEDASSAQFTDTKMTVLLPWVTLGSGLNWCDILVGGGTGPGLGEFSEIGSGCIHFNFTPRGDKATASCIGNVVDGVFLDQPRVFIGGNGSLVGPLSAPCGAVTGAGGRFAGVLQAGLNAAQPDPPSNAEFDLEAYGSIQRVVQSQCTYIGELAALNAWYRDVRLPMAATNADRAELYRRAQAVVQANIAERIAHLEALAGRMPRSAEAIRRRTPGDARIAQQHAFHTQWPALRNHLEGWGDPSPCPAALAQAVTQAAQRESAYTRIIRALPPAAKDAGRGWLRGIRDRVAQAPALARIPALPARS